MTQKPYPQRPVSTLADTPDQAVASAIKQLSAKGLTLEMLSCIDKEDVGRMALLLNIGRDTDAWSPFLTDYVYTELALQCSVVMKRGGIRSEQIVDVSKAPAMMPMDNWGIIGGIKRRLNMGGR